MKRFTSILLAALIGVFAYAQATVKFNPDRLRTVQTTKVAPVAVNGTMSSLPATVVSKKAKAPKKAPATAAELAGSYTWDYATASEYAEDPTTVEQTPSSANVTITVDDAGALTLTGMFPNALTATYDAEEGAIVVDDDQVVGTSSYGDYIIRGLFYYAGDDTYEAGWYYTSIVGYINDEGVITFENWFVRVLSSGNYAGYSLTPYYVTGSTLTPSDPVTVVEAPEGLVTEEYSISARNYADDADVNGSVFIGFDGNDVYVKGLCTWIPDAWVKGTLDGTTVTFAKGQYFGNYGGTYDMYLNVLRNADVVFTYDSEAGTFTAQNELFLVDNSQYYFDSYRGAVLTKVTEVAATPADPSITGLRNTNYGYVVLFNVPTVDTEGNGMVSSKLSYQFFTDVEHTVTPLTFTSATHSKLSEDMTIIPYGFTEDYDFYDGQIYLNELYSEDWNKIGIKSIYTGGGETHETEIQWLTLKKYAEEIALDNLNSEITTAEALVADEANTRGTAALQTAIDAAKEASAKEDATADELNAAIEALQAAEQAFTALNALPADGVYYLYNAYAQKFASRGAAWGTQAVADDYGLPINIAINNEGKTTLQMLDNGVYFGDDYWMYADCSGDRVRTYIVETTEGGYYLHNSSREVEDNRMYVYLKDDADKYAIAGNAIEGDNVETLQQAVWQFLTQAERDTIIAARETAAHDAAFEATEINEEEPIAEGEPSVLTFKTGSAWTFTAKRGGSSAATNDYGTETYQGTGHFTQSVSNLEPGLYKVSIQAFYRDGSNAAVSKFTNQGYNLSVVYLEANGNKALVKSWGIDRADDANPNSMAEAATLFAEGKYLSETYAVVGEDGQLNLTVAVPSYIGYGWFIADNVTYTKVENKPAVNIYELISINPAEGEVESLQNFQITFGGEVVTVNEDIFPTLDGQDGGIAVSEDGKTVSIDFEEAVTAAGNYQLDIPAGAILYNGIALDPLAFRYTIKGADYTIDPAEGNVEKLENFTITFNNYMVELNTEQAQAILFNEENEAEIQATGIYDIAGGTKVYITFPEVNTPGNYQLIIMDASIQKLIDSSYLPELTFNYTITVPVGIQGVAGEGNNVRYFDATGRAVNSNAKGIIIQQTRQTDGTVKTIKVVRR